jgi:hypothetical protein
VCPSCELARPIEITVSDSSPHANFFDGDWDGRSDSSVGGKNELQVNGPTPAWDDCDSGHSLNVQSTVEQQINFELPQEDLLNCITIDIESTIEFWVRLLDLDTFYGSPSKMMALAEDCNNTNEETPLLTARFKNRFVVDNDTFHVKYARTSVWLNLESPTCSFIAEKAAEKMRTATISHQEYWDVVDKHKSLEVRKQIDEAPTSLPLQKDGEAIPARSVVAVPEVPGSECLSKTNLNLSSGATHSAATSIDSTVMSSTESLASTPILPQVDAPHGVKKKSRFRRWW